MNTNTANKLTAIAQNQQKVYDAGYAQGEKDFWDTIQDFGNRTDYTNYFSAASWTDETFKPKHNMTPITGTGMFRFSCIQDLAGILTRQGVTLDFSQDSAPWYPFSDSKLTRAPAIDFARAKYYNQTFQYCYDLQTVEKLVSTADYRWYNTFKECSALVNLTIEGTIGKDGFNVSWSTKLTHKSLMSIINALADYHGDGLIHTVTLGEVNLAKLTDAEKAIATERGWTLA